MRNDDIMSSDVDFGDAASLFLDRNSEFCCCLMEDGTSLIVCSIAAVFP